MASSHARRGGRSIMKPKRNLATPFVVSLSVAMTTAACGGSASESDDTRGGVGGVAGSAGSQAGMGGIAAGAGVGGAAAGAGGTAGGGATAGGGTGAVGGGSSGAAGCPPGTPADGANCSPDGASCTYNGGLGCDQLATCTAGSWRVTYIPDGFCNPPAVCPSSPPPSDGAPCYGVGFVLTCSWGSCPDGSPEIVANCDGQSWKFSSSSCDGGGAGSGGSG